MSPSMASAWERMASSGAVIIAWLEERHRELSDVSTGQILNQEEILRPRIRPQSIKATAKPLDSDLVHACERWLAVTGTPDQQVEDYAVPARAPVQTTQPVRMPSFVRDTLESVGVNGFGG